jgi:hypothetical protein
MSKFSDYLEEQILDATLKSGTFPTIGTVYLATFTSDPTDAGSGTESTWNANSIAYARQAMTFGAISTSGTGKEAASSTQIQFPAFQGSSHVVTHIGIYDAATSGNLLYHTNLATSKTLTQDDVLSFAVNGVTVTLD